MTDGNRFSVPGIIYGGIIGGVVGAANVAFGLKTMLTLGTSITTAVLVFAVHRLLHRGVKFTPQQNVVAATVGSSAGYMAATACLVSAVPALDMLGQAMTPWQLVLWALSVSTLGIVFAIPIRRRMIVDEPLPFPTGTATAETVRVLHAEGGGGGARPFVVGAAIAGVFCLWMNLPWLPWNLPDRWLFTVTVGGVTLSAYTIGINLSPMLYGAGAILGVRTGWSMIVGALLHWGVIAPRLVAHGLVEKASFKAVVAWSVWSGAAILVTSGLTAFLLGSGVVKRVFRVGPAVAQPTQEGREGEVPRAWFVALLAFSVAFTVAMCRIVFDIPVLYGLIAVVIAAFASVIAVRSIGETDFNPTGALGKISQFAFGAISPGAQALNLMAAGVSAAATSQAADLMSDLKAGYLLKVPPWRQVAAQFAGVLFGVAMVVPAYLLIIRAFKLGGDQFPAPAAQLWKTVAQLMTQGTGALPPMAWEAIAIASAVAAALTILDRVQVVRRYVPSPMAIGLSFILSANLVIAIGLGAVISWAVLNRTTRVTRHVLIPFASGLIGGEGIMMVVVAAAMVLAAL